MQTTDMLTEKKDKEKKTNISTDVKQILNYENIFYSSMAINS